MKTTLGLLAGLLPLSAHAAAPPPCPATIVVVERTDRSTAINLGADASSAELCRVVRDGVPGLYWFGSWKNDWPGAEAAAAALRQVYAGPAGTEVKFDVVAAPGYSWHETLRNEGYEDLNVAGGIHHTMKVAHEREGFDGNSYHSIITSWKDMTTGVTVYQNYNHIAGHPEPGGSWDPLTIVEIPR